VDGRSVVVDTHALVWHLLEPRRLGRAARRVLAATDAGRWACQVPAVTLVEVWLLHERGRLRVGPTQLLEVLAGHPSYSVLPLDVAQAIEFGALPGIRDPMDRMIVAAARVTGSRLVTADESLKTYGIETIWD
jgi:PIN domain nuclease of toxin-antitoxin system